MKKPSVEEIQKRYKSYEKYYETLHAQQKEMDGFYELVFDADVPPGYATRMPSTARDWIDVGVRHFTLDNPKSKVFPRNSSESARKQVEILETFYNFWLRKDVVAIKDAAKKLLIRGEVFLKVNMDASYFGSTDENRLFHFPLSLTVPDPINVFASPGHSGFNPPDVIECFKITVAEAEDMCERNGWKWTTSKKPDQFVEWFSYISAEWRCFLLDKIPVLTPEVQPNILGFCNYVHVDSGAGQSSYEGKPEYQYRALTWGKRDMLKMEAKTFSVYDAINERFAWLRYKAKGDPELIKKYYPEGVPTDPSQLLYEIPDQLEFSILEGGNPPPGLLQELAMVQAQALPPTVLGGGKPPGVYSGTHQEGLMSAAKTTYKAPFKNLEEILGIGMGMGTRITEKVYNYPIQIKNFASEEKQYMEVKPSDINGHYDCEVQLLAEPPEATDIRKALGQSLRQGGSISHMTELRDYQNKSLKEAEDEIAQMFAENALKEPGVRDVAAKDAMARLGMDKELEALEEAEGSAERPIPPVPKGRVNTDMVRQRGRSSSELERSPTLGEHEVER